LGRGHSSSQAGGQSRGRPPRRDHPKHRPQGQERPGGRAGGGRGFGPAALPPDSPYTRPTYAYQPNEWNPLEIILDANYLRVWINDGPEGGSTNGQADEDFAKYGPVALYVGGTGEVRFKQVEFKDLGRHFLADEKVSSRFREQRISDFYYAWSATAADVNHDGVLDILAGPFYYLGPDYRVSREIYPSKTSTVGTEYTGAMVNFAYDYTGDGWPDVLVASGRPMSLYVNPKAELRRWDKYNVLPTINSEVAVFKDMDGDGKPDAVFLGGVTVCWASADPASPTAPWIVHAVSEPGYGVVAQHGIGAGAGVEQLGHRIVRFDLNRVRVELQPQSLDDAARERFPIDVRIRCEVRVVIADRTVHLCQQHHTLDAVGRCGESHRYVGEFLAHRGGAGRLPVRTRQHRQIRVPVRLIPQLDMYGVQAARQHRTATLEHQCVRDIVDVFRRAREMDEFGGAAQSGTLAPPDEVLDRLDVVIRLRFYGLDFNAVFDTEVSHKLLQSARGSVRQRWKLGQAKRREADEPGDFDAQPFAHERKFGKNVTQLGRLPAVAAVQWRNCG
jgi:hypothetical protein